MATPGGVTVDGTLSVIDLDTAAVVDTIPDVNFGQITSFGVFAITFSFTDYVFGADSATLVMPDLFNDAIQFIDLDAAKANPVASMPAPATVEAEAPESLQVVSAAKPVLRSLADTRVRTWIDNTGQFRTDGRLIEINQDNVRLMKTNGRTCTVPHSRLCEADAAYVKAIAKKLQLSQLAMLTSK